MNKVLMFIVSSFFFFSCSHTKQHGTEKESVTAIDMHTSKNALDWKGVYTGLIPCADCEGIKQQLLLKDSTYLLSMQYVGKSDSVFVSEGSFRWSDDERTIRLLSLSNTLEAIYQVGENVLVKLDMECNKIESPIAEKYVLKKLDANLVGKQWTLIELKGSEGLLKSFSSKEDMPYLLFTDETAVSGSGGCNNFFGSYTLHAETLTIEPKGSTRKYCFETMDIEDAFLASLKRVRSYQRQEDRLFLYDKQKNVVASFVYTFFTRQ